jgi:hypothetical protein
MANAAANKAEKPFATRWIDDEVVKVGGMGEGVLVATAPTPPVTGP